MAHGTGTNPGIKIPSEGEASTAVRTALQQITKLIGFLASPTYGSLTLTGLSSSRLLSTDASKKLASADLNSWVAGTTNRITVTDDGDGTITLSGPQDIHTGASPTFVNLGLTGDLNLTEMSAPATPSADHLLIYALDDSGFSVLESKDSTGATVRIMQDTYRVAKNTTANPITKGQVVYFSGSTGGVPTVGLAKADYSTTMPAVGIAIADVAAAAYGRFMVAGRLTGINTSTFGAGSPVYVSAATAGLMTTTSPLHPNFSQALGTVEVSDATAGAILFNIGPILKGEESGTRLNNFTIGDTFSGNKTLTFDGTANGVISWASGTSVLTLPGTTAVTALTVGTLTGALIGTTGVVSVSTPLTNIAALAATDSNIIVGNGTTWVAETGATARTSLGLGTGDSPTFAGLTVNGLATHTATVTTTAQTGLAMTLNVSTAGGDLATGIGFTGRTNVTGANNLTSNVVGLFGIAANSGTGTTALLRGLAGWVISNAAGTTTAAHTLGAASPYVSSGAITTAYGLYIYQQKATGVTTGYGIYQADSGDINNFVGKCKFGTAGTPAENVHASDTVRADTFFNLNGTDGVTQTAGSPSSITTAGGIVTAVTVDGTPTYAGVLPLADNTYYLGKNDDDTPFAWKGLILKDQAGTGKYYRLEVSDDALRIVDLTD
jgi:hypothetical protein